MPTTTVVHCKRDAYDVYIGRKRQGMHYGNPFSHQKAQHTIHVPTREDAVGAFREWILEQDHHEVEPMRRAWILMNLENLRGKRLGCFCAPQECHGDVFVELVGQAGPGTDRRQSVGMRPQKRRR